MKLAVALAPCALVALFFALWALVWARPVTVENYLPPPPGCSMSSVLTAPIRHRWG